MTMENANLEQFLEVGISVIIHSDPTVKSSPRVPSVIRGWESGNYILVDNPHASNGESVLHEKAVSGIRYLLDGKACAFDTPVIALENGAAGKSVRLKWPESIERVDFRKTERINVHVPCTASIEGKEDFKGEILDVSLGGCYLATEIELTPKTTITISFTFPDGEVLENAKATICNAREQDDHFAHGLAFEKEETNGLVAVASYISRVSERRRTDSGELEMGVRYLILENDREIADKNATEFKDADQDCTTTHNMIDAMYHLRIALPKALLIKSDIPELSGLEIGRIIRTVFSADHLPIHIYGNMDEPGKAKAEKLGITCHADLETMMKTILANA